MEGLLVQANRLASISLLILNDAVVITATASHLKYRVGSAASIHIVSGLS